MKKMIVTFILSLSAIGPLQAQVHLLKGKNYQPTGVSNDGLVVGFTDQAKPYRLWNPQTGEFKEIGGIAEGMGHGGRAKFSADGKYIGGSILALMDWGDTWQAYPQHEADYTINGFGISDAFTMFALGYDRKTSNGVLLKSPNGHTWREVIKGDRPEFRGALNDACFMVDNVGLLCGDGAFFAYTTSKGASWAEMDPRPEGNTDEVDSYSAVHAIPVEPYVCAVGVRLKDGGYTVYQSPDGAETWQATKGVLGVPVHISHSGFTLYMATENGHIQRSTDLGLNWTDIFHTDKPLYKVYFSERQTGMALSDNGTIFRTMDGGTTWTEISVKRGITDNVKWNDLMWDGTAKATIIGTEGSCYVTEDRGNNWRKVEMDTENDLMAIAKIDEKEMIGGAKGEFYLKITEMPEVSMMGRYDVVNNEWTTIGTLGYRQGVSAGSGYAMSGDGKVIVGAYAVSNPASTETTGFVHGAAWVDGKGLIDLGGLYDNVGRSTRANAVSYDGSVIVGWQDQAGPWHAAVWRRDADGNYGTNEFILKDPEKGSGERTNRAGDAHSVSQNGKWIGGKGGGKATTATDAAWIWSKETGLIELNEEGYSGCTTAINDEGTLAFGYTGGGQGAFMWTKEEGYLDFNDYVANTLKYDLGEVYLCSILAMSPNGRYVCGWGIEPSKADPTQAVVVGFVADLADPAIVEDVMQTQCDAAIYPNPAIDYIHVDLPYDDVDTRIQLIDMQGRVVLNQNTTTMQNTLVLNGVAPGLYILDVKTEGAHKSYKVEVGR